ncbi:hypothetical protein CsatA_008920 [Cannabis sativa]
MENKISLFGNVVKNKNTFFLPTPLATSIKAIPMSRGATLYISDRVFSGLQGFRGVRPVFMLDGRVKFEGKEWNTFVSDRGIRVGDVLLMRIAHSYPYLINLTLIRLDTKNINNPTLIIPPLPNTNQSHHDHDDDLDDLDYVGFQNKPFLCVKIVSEDDLKSNHFHQIEMPKEIGEVIMEKAEDLIQILNEDDFGVVVWEQSFPQNKINN